MVVWLKPCESRSLPGASSQTPRFIANRGVCSWSTRPTGLPLAVTYRKGLQATEGRSGRGSTDGCLPRPALSSPLLSWPIKTSKTAACGDLLRSCSLLQSWSRLRGRLLAASGPLSSHSPSHPVQDPRMAACSDSPTATPRAAIAKRCQVKAITASSPPQTALLFDNRGVRL